MLMSAELKDCVTWFIFFLDFLWVRYNCAKFHNCRYVWQMLGDVIWKKWPLSFPLTPCKSWGPVKPPIFENLVGVPILPTRKGWWGGAHDNIYIYCYLWSPWFENETMGVTFYHVITIYILFVNGLFFEGIAMRYNKVDLLYQNALKYYHHAENYQQSILQGIIPFGLLLKKRAAINPVSPDFNNHWNGILKDAERKPLTLLLDEVQKIS